jgi:hypothetical protein
MGSTATVTTLQTRSTTDLMDQINEWIKNPPETSRVVSFTPKAAATILGVGTDTPGMNTHNRARKPSKIKEYANDMESQAWHLTGDTIKFTKTGKLGDGQNRLYACVRARKAFLTHVVFGIDDAVFPWLDKGRTRSIGDDFFVDGMDNPQLLAHVMRWLELFRLDKVKDRTTFTRAEIRAAYFNQGYDHELIHLGMEKGLAVQKANNTPRSLAAALYYLFAQKDRALADEFFEAWASGTWAGRMSPIKKANMLFAKIVRENPLIRVHDTMRAAVWVIAWNFVVRNKKGSVKDFEWTNLRPFPKIAGTKASSTV